MSDRRNPRVRTRRRTMLRGLGGIALALPFLELLDAPKAKAGGGAKPMRYIFGFGGSSLGIDGMDAVIPASEGALAGQITRGLQPLEDLGLTDVVSIVSGLEIPYGPDGSIPAGGRYIEWHSSSPCPLACGVRTQPGDESLQGPTSDWIVAEQIAQGLANQVLAYRVQAAFYRGSNDTGGIRGRLSARMNGGTLEDVPPISSIKTAYQGLISGFVPPDPGEAAAAQFLLERRKSVIDLVRGDTEKLLPKLGKADKVRLERHFDELRALEARLAAVEPPDSPACQAVGDPGEDPPIGGAVENGEQGSGGGYDSNAAYSDEEKRATVLVDLIHMAMACDMARVANLLFTYSQCFLNMNPIYGYPTDLHEMSHYSMGGGEEGANAMADGIAWHVKHWGRLLQKLRDTEDFDGSSMLDSTSAVLCFEGGYGYDPEQDAQGSAHSSENMAVLIGGRAGGLHMSGGKHLPRAGRHPAEVINTAMQAVGVDQQLGEVSGSFDELFG
ncbi:MAG: DUF1552 domain-containing protein [Polyangiaceae bacterium]|nr:DUF1552 domain-containing protein [Polyangiaceae bacterium]